jgi:hypothetical protein
MSQYAFGAGQMYVTPLLDATGASVLNPTPMKLMDLQEGSVDMSAEMKKLYGQNSFPVAIGIGKRDIQVKVKPAKIMASTWNTLFFGQTLSAGLIANFSDTVGAAIPATPFSITVSPPSTGTFVCDLGVLDSTGTPMKRVASAPATGQYSLNPATGAYTFAAADTGKTVYINYQYTATVTGAQKQTVQNLAMGYAPTFKADLTVTYQGKNVTFSFLNCVAAKMGMAFKNEDFAVPDFDFGAFDNGAGSVMQWSTNE